MAGQVAIEEKKKEGLRQFWARLIAASNIEFGRTKVANNNATSNDGSKSSL